MNLVINAAESLLEQPGCVTLTTGVQKCDQTCLAASRLNEKPAPGRFLFLEVSDNGCGMSKETLKRLFDPFFTTKFTGRGLGMSSVMGIIRTHGGALFVESEPGRGTTFRALFPIPDSALPAEVHETIAPRPEQCAIPERRLSRVALVVDDEKSVLKICTKMVNLCGFSTITACDGIDAVAKFREHADDIVVVLMDLTMPNMDGLTAMGEIYSIRPDIKVILSSGFNEEELSERITSQPPSGFIRKPYSFNALEAEIRRVVQSI
jgi:CheY-like chemotaxis protein